MNTKRKLLFSFVGLILSIAIFSTVVFAWFTMGGASSEFIVETGVLETDTDLYHRVYDYETQTYKWNLVDTVKEANYIFNNIVPGQVITFKLQLSNCSYSSVKSDYVVKIGKILFGDETDEDLTLTSTSQHLFNAINIKIDQYVEIDDDQTVKKFPVTTEKVNGINVATEVIVDDSIVNSFEIAIPKGETNEFSPVNTSKQLREYLDAPNKTMVNSEDSIEPGNAVVYIIRLYFNPLFGEYNGEKEVSTGFMKQKFYIQYFEIQYTQEKKITE